MHTHLATRLMQDSYPLPWLQKKYLIEQLQGEKIISRKKGFTVDACVGPVEVTQETPQFQGLPTGDKVGRDGYREVLMTVLSSHPRLQARLDTNAIWVVYKPQLDYGTFSSCPWIRGPSASSGPWGAWAKARSKLSSGFSLELGPGSHALYAKNRICRKSEGQDLKETCRSACEAACTEALDSYGQQVTQESGFALLASDKARMARSCTRNCAYECGKPGKAFDFVIPYRRRRVTHWEGVPLTARLSDMDTGDLLESLVVKTGSWLAARLIHRKVRSGCFETCVTYTASVPTAGHPGNWQFTGSVCVYVAQLGETHCMQLREPMSQETMLGFLGCMRKECPLCKNNPNKKCREDDNFDECYADGQVLKSKCEADVYLELVNLRTGAPEALPGVEIAVSVIDGESYNENTAGNYNHIKELLKNDDESILLGAYQAGVKAESDGRVYLRMNEGQVKLPDLCVTDKNDTFHLNNETFGTFRLTARAVRREGYGVLTLVENIRPAVSGRFIVKTQRALNDYRKSEYPHFKDELTKLKFIGSITAQRLREIHQHLDCPYSSIETVEQLKQLMLYADQNRQVENKSVRDIALYALVSCTINVWAQQWALFQVAYQCRRCRLNPTCSDSLDFLRSRQMLELLNMKGKHKHKWDYLREVLAERVVYDDMMHRLWYTDDNMVQGVIFACKQGQVNMDRPIGLVQRAATGRLVVSSGPTGQDAETLKQWRGLAESAWHTPGHRGWVMVQEQLEMANAGTGGTSILIGAGPSMSIAPGPSISMADGMDTQMLGRRGSVGMTPLMHPDSARSRRSSAVSYHQGPGSPECTPQAMFQQATSGYADSGMQQQQQLQAVGAQQSQQQQAPFQFTATSSPMFTHNSADSPGGGGSCLMGVAGGAGGGMGGLGGPPDLTLPPPPARSTRYRRLSADAGASVRQLAMMQAAGMQQSSVELHLDLTGKRSRNSAPGHQMLEELQLQQQQLGMNAEMQVTSNNRHALYHFESRGRHTPRSRLSQEISDTVAAAALSGVLDASDIEAYLAQNFTFVTTGAEPTYSGGIIGAGADQRGMAGMAAASNSSLGLGAASPTGISAPLMQMSMQHSDQLTGQMQHTLILNDPSSRMGIAGSGCSSMLGLDAQQQQVVHNHSHQSQQQQHSGYGVGMGAAGGGAGGSVGSRSLQHMDSGNVMLNQSSRELKRCESDSFKRFLAVGLPFSPMEATPEDLLEGLHRDAGLIGDTPRSYIRDCVHVVLHALCLWGLHSMGACCRSGSHLVNIADSSGCPPGLDMTHQPASGKPYREASAVVYPLIFYTAARQDAGF
ncbi:hypothetical protein VOLCADRAFT_105916 [Volvox carteri f. nagariensis]|uniref:Uncharacterized protein n=1 Tax=Volvox carteri f. nagariensis TaxID=3068 RepID=D8U4A9_VOLCA|nr:uncharacterized protein VOLCADRAFT_105916 [Volvox carteri f. nagariensis]EFJ45471.1 hypothetical protein VOLCADRAFT_105916 [Volvox carteri f. nagariensis]|eukprot:XP_002953498.1 hypothetical protein VOLCADRAFT_105916 [Volvox carteri f. nagariensis]